MDKGRWRQIEQAFQTAAELDPTALEAHLVALARSDADLAAEVGSLLAAETGPISDAVARAAEGLERAARQAEAMVDHERAITGLRFGPFRARRLLGVGGMGAVYLGERTTEDFQQTVALKVVRTAAVSPETRERFRNERRILASLHHDRIARLIDGGVADDGQTPWFAMELVDGRPLLEALADATLETRLRTFLEICAAVQHAHRNLIVHRDLKPSNILVDRDGRPKLLDFGIAKVLAPTEPDGPPDESPEGLRPMTPSYAAPEQLRGEAVTTATDVYALGVVLYELLTGRHPFVEEQRSGALQRAILESTPTPPSNLPPTRPLDTDGGPSAGRPRFDPRVLSGDLDNICLMALRKRPEQRYTSVTDLAEDLRRFLDHEPVRATPASPTYRLRKLVQRNRTATATAVLAGVVLAGASALYGVRLTHERDVARAESTKATQVATFLTELFSANDPSVAHATDVSARALLDRGVARIDRELADQPAVRADLLHVMGDVHKRLGLYALALDLLERAAALDAELGDGRTVERALSLYRAGEVHLYEERFAPAEAKLREALALQRAVLPLPAGAVADTLDLLGRLERLRREPDAAELLHQEALAIRRQLFDETSLPVAESLQSLGMLRHGQGRPDDALLLLREALAVREKLLGADHPETVELQQNIAATLQRTGALEEALEALRAALDGTRAAYGADHQNVAWTLSSIAYSLQQLGRLDEAVAHDRQAVEIMRAREAGAQGVSPLVQMARHLTEAGRLGEAEEAAREALVWLGDTPEGPDPKRSNILVALGTILTQQARYDEAESALRETLRLDIATHGDDHPYVAQDRYKLGDLARVAGRPTDALPWLDQALERQRRLRPGANALGLTLTSRGEALLDLGRVEDAEASFREALDVFAVQTPEEHPDYTAARLGLGATLAARGATDEARPLLESAARQLAAALGDAHPQTRRARQRLALLP